MDDKAKSIFLKFLTKKSEMDLIESKFVSTYDKLINF